MCFIAFAKVREELHRKASISDPISERLIHENNAPNFPHIDGRTGRV